VNKQGRNEQRKVRNHVPLDYYLAVTTFVWAAPGRWPGGQLGFVFARRRKPFRLAAGNGPRQLSASAGKHAPPGTSGLSLESRVKRVSLWI